MTRLGQGLALALVAAMDVGHPAASPALERGAQHDDRPVQRGDHGLGQHGRGGGDHHHLVATGQMLVQRRHARPAPAQPQALGLETRGEVGAGVAQLAFAQPRRGDPQQDRGPGPAGARRDDHRNGDRGDQQRGQQPGNGAASPVPQPERRGIAVQQSAVQIEDREHGLS
jgi:hypothetical protein